MIFEHTIAFLAIKSYAQLPHTSTHYDIFIGSATHHQVPLYTLGRLARSFRRPERPDPPDFSHPPSPTYLHPTQSYSMHRGQLPRTEKRPSQRGQQHQGLDELSFSSMHSIPTSSTPSHDTPRTLPGPLSIHIDHRILNLLHSSRRRQTSDPPFACPRPFAIATRRVL